MKKWRYFLTGYYPFRSVIPGLLFVSAVACDSGDQGGARKKSMPDMHYAYSISADEPEDRDTGIARMMEIYAANPSVFGDPVAIIDSFTDSTRLIPSERRFGLILLDSSWTPAEGTSKGVVAGGPVISISSKAGFDDIESGWIEISEYLSTNGLVYLPPGMEIYRGYGSEYPHDSTEIFIRIE